MKFISLITYLLLISSLLFSAPYSGKIVEFKQPDATFVKVKLYGDEFYLRGESIDGYTVIRDSNSNWICYAVLSNDKTKLVSSGIKYLGNVLDKELLYKNNLIEKHIEISATARKIKVNQNQKLLNGESYTTKKDRGTPVVPVLGNIKGLCIVIDFPDEQASVPISEFEDFCNDMNYSNNGNVGSVRKYYWDISGGIIDYENIVFGYYRAPKNFTYYDSLPYAKGAQIILDSALRWIQKQGFDFSTLSVNPDNTIRAINMMYTGNPPNWAQGMWHHKGSFTSFSANGVTTKDYNCSPANAPLKLSVVVHENGHMIGKWPDTYKYTNDNGVDGIGSFDLMCWMGNDGGNPVPPNPLFAANAGWKNVIDITNFNGVIYDTSNSFTCYKYVNMNDTNEFFLIESRMKTGRSTQIEDQGLTIWHIDRKGDNQTTHHEVFLEHANDNNADHSRACFRKNYKNEFSANTKPNSNFYNGQPSGLKIWDVSNVGAVMNFKVGKGVPSPILRLLFQEVNGDDNNNKMIEPGETFNLNLKALNIGQIDASDVTIQSEVIKGEEQLTSITNKIEHLQVKLIDTLPITLKYKLTNNAEVGSELTFKFTIFNNLDTISILKSFVVGNIKLMNNQSDTLCQAVLFDDGGAYGVYSDEKDYVKTFYPENNLKPIMIDFQEFEIEHSDNCMYDYLEIYNGENTQAELIGKFCGNNKPDKIISSDKSGAITIKFHSDEGSVGKGWKAIVKCLYENDYIPEDFINIIPNPGSEQFIVRVYNENILNVSVIDIMGRKIANRNSINSKECLFDMSSQKDGVYFLKIETPSRKVVKKWVLKK